MAGELPNVVPGEPVESVWGNEVRDRILSRYADRTERDFLNPLPDSGDQAWILNTLESEVYNGTEWIVQADQPWADTEHADLQLDIDTRVLRAGDVMTGDLQSPNLTATQILEAGTAIVGPRRMTIVTNTTVEALPESPSGLVRVSFTQPTTGRYLLTVRSDVNYSSLTNADIVRMRLLRQSDQGQFDVVLTNMFRDWGAPGITSGHANTVLITGTPNSGAGTTWEINLNREGSDGSANATTTVLVAERIEL